MACNKYTRNSRPLGTRKKVSNWILDFGFGTWIWDLDLGPRFGTGLGLEN